MARGKTESRGRRRGGEKRHSLPSFLFFPLSFPSPPFMHGNFHNSLPEERNQKGGEKRRELSDTVVFCYGLQTGSSSSSSLPPWNGLSLLFSAAGFFLLAGPLLCESTKGLHPETERPPSRHFNNCTPTLRERKEEEGRWCATKCTSRVLGWINEPEDNASGAKEEKGEGKAGRMNDFCPQK